MMSSSESMEIEANEHSVRLALLGEGFVPLDYGLVARIAQFMRANGSMRESEVKMAYRLLIWERTGQVNELDRRTQSGMTRGRNDGTAAGIPPGPGLPG